MMDRLPDIPEIISQLTPLQDNITKLEKYIRVLKKAGVDTTAYEQQLRDLKTKYQAMMRALQEELGR
ncbi:MAG: hypothetical protein QW795_07225 [Candidatus Bathyarchaeia archaeon]